MPMPRQNTLGPGEVYHAPGRGVAALLQLLPLAAGEGGQRERAEDLRGDVGLQVARRWRIYGNL